MAIDFLIGLMALSCQYNYIIFFANVHSVSDGFAPVLYNSVLSHLRGNSLQDVPNNGHGCLCPGIIRGDNGKVRVFDADLPHNWPLHRVPVSAAAENRNESTLAEIPHGQQNLFQAVRRVGIVDEHGIGHSGGWNHLNAALDTGYLFQGSGTFLQRNAKLPGNAQHRQGIVNRKAAGNGHRHVGRLFPANRRKFHALGMEGNILCIQPCLFVGRNRQNRQIKKQLEDLKNAESARKEFTANVSHELKTPLMSISGYAELMMNGMVPPDKMQDFSGRIFHESERLSNLVADIIQLSRLDEKNGETMFEQVNIGELGEDVINNLQNRAAKKKINLEYTGGPAQMQGVRHVLYEMFYNITDNAIRYTPDGGDVKVFVGKLNGKPYFRVEDNGIGIPESEQQRIFERFYRVDKSHSRETGGTGLGLSIVKHGAVLHHAKILLDSEPGKGTKMEILFDQTK